MSKIVSAVNAMIINRDKISNVLLGNDGSLFFEYDGKYKWSMMKREEDTILWYYPGGDTLALLASLQGDEWGDFPMVTYRTSEIGTREAKESFNELLVLLKEKMYGMDDVLNQIIIDGEKALPF